MVPKRIPISAAKDFASPLGLRQVIIMAWDGELSHVVTYGKTIKDCAEAAEGGNLMKKAMGWPDDKCHDIPARIKRRENASTKNLQLP